LSTNAFIISHQRCWLSGEDCVKQQLGRDSWWYSKKELKTGINTNDYLYSGLVLHFRLDCIRDYSSMMVVGFNYWSKAFLFHPIFLICRGWYIYRFSTPPPFLPNWFSFLEWESPGVYHLGLVGRSDCNQGALCFWGQMCH